MFSDDPEFRAGLAVIHGEKSQSVNEPVLIGLAIFFVNFTPIATNVSAEGNHDFIVGHNIQNTSRCD
jgi:hypothetical protein